jgi:hypothetical protein
MFRLSQRLSITSTISLTSNRFFIRFLYDMWFGAVLLAGLASSAVASFQASISGPAAVTAVSNRDGLDKGRNKWVAYKGDGSAKDGWPKKSEWASFEYM